jgi:hypothetical protein
MKQILHVKKQSTLGEDRSSFRLQLHLSLHHNVILKVRIISVPSLQLIAPITADITAKFKLH